MASIQVTVDIKNKWLDRKYPALKTHGRTAGICAHLNSWSAGPHPRIKAFPENSFKQVKVTEDSSPLLVNLTWLTSS